MTNQEIAKKYVDLIQQGKHEECLSSLFSRDASSVEAVAMPGMDRVSNGLAAIRAKGEWWTNNHIIHKEEVHGPYPHDNRFAVRFVYDVTNKPSGQRFNMDEVGLFTIEDGKIVREEFFYSQG